MAEFKDGELLEIPDADLPKCPQWIVRPTDAPTHRGKGVAMQVVRYRLRAADVWVAVCPSCGAQVQWQGEEQP